VTFVPDKPARNRPAQKLELAADFEFPASSLPWSFAEGERAAKTGSVLVDTDGDQTPDTLLPGTSNFSPGSSPDLFGAKLACPDPCADTCHLDPSTGKIHCTTPFWPSNCPRTVCP